MRPNAVHGLLLESYFKLAREKRGVSRINMKSGSRLEN
jgi:hypothetical protein